MARKLPDTMPTTLEGWHELVDIAYENGQEEYAEAVAKAKAEAGEAWDKELPAKRAELIKQAEANIRAEVIDSPDGPVSLSEAEVAAKLVEVTAQIDAELARQREEHVSNAVGMVEQPQTREAVAQMYSCYKPQEQAEPEPEPAASVALYDATWKLGDTYWNIAEAKYVDADTVDQSKVIALAGAPTAENLRANIKLYSRYDNRIKLGPEIMDTEELFTRLRERRAERLVEYDNKISQLDRQIRENPDYAEYTLKRASWDEYATALCNLPSQDGAPWDGGGVKTPWPAKPE